MKIQTITKSFKDLTAEELYSILYLRNQVFVIEQNCVYQDLDNKDQLSFHVLIYADEVLAAYARILPPGLSYPEASIGRVLTHINFRGHGFGKRLINASIDGCYKKFGRVDIRISAQYYTLKFYGSFGFQAEGEKYMEDGIPHIQMLKPANDHT